MYNTDTFEKMFKMGKNSSLPFADLNKTTSDLCHNLAKESMEIFNDNMTLLSDQMKRLTSIKKPEDLLNLTRDYLKEDMEAGVASAQRLIQLQTTGMEEITSKLSGKAREFSEKAREFGEEAKHATENAIHKNTHDFVKGFKGKDKSHK